MNDDISWPRALLFVTLFTLGWGLLLSAGSGNDVPPPATVTVTVTPTAWTEPYGGCKEAAQYPRSTGYAECQQHGLLP